MILFNKDLKETAIRRVKRAAREYEAEFENVNNKSIELFELKTKSKNEIIIPVENFINKLANSPKEFEKSIGELNHEFQNFKNEIKRLEMDAQNTEFQMGGNAAAGIAAGLGAAALLPTGAMAVATTFGVASTGTAISALSGAAATNAALAWLGGGALVAGGGGMAAGSALLALAGPIGWGIAGTGIIGAGLFASSKNKKIAEEANEQRYEIELGIKKLKLNIEKINGFIQLINDHNIGIKQILRKLEITAPKNYKDYSIEEKHMLAALINHVEGLAKLINKKVV
ncbi:hypothetical protein [Cetobacterium sp. SF1]|uniref:hypothetical protein n=1 Tax=Cetobacterium sp. SF1 TaxID=3417654 RepID=UPI003CEFE674